MAILPNKASIKTYSSKIARSDNFFTGADNLSALDFDPLVTGYAFILWTHVPKWVTDTFEGFKELTQKNFQSFQGLDDLTLETGQHQYGFAANEYEVATNLKKNNTEFTVRHAEYSGSPIKNMYQYWVTGIRDPRTGIATYPKLHGIDYAAKNHTGELLYIVTRPDADNVGNEAINNIEFAALYTNVFPTKVPLGHLNYEQGTHDVTNIEITFKGTLNISPQVDEFAKKKLRDAYAFVYEGGFRPSESGQVQDSVDGGGRLGSQSKYNTLTLDAFQESDGYDLIK
jgi:hypothetical protein